MLKKRGHAKVSQCRPKVIHHPTVLFCTNNVGVELIDISLFVLFSYFSPDHWHSNCPHAMYLVGPFWMILGGITWTCVSCLPGTCRCPSGNDSCIIMATHDAQQAERARKTQLASLGWRKAGGTSWHEYMSQGCGKINTPEPLFVDGFEWKNDNSSTTIVNALDSVGPSIFQSTSNPHP